MKVHSMAGLMDEATGSKMAAGRGKRMEFLMVDQRDKSTAATMGID
jgi:hypothetical protein